MSKLLNSLAVVCFAVTVHAASTHPKETFLPKNNLHIAVGSMDAKGISQAEFNAVMDQIEAVYGPIIASRGAQLNLNRLWDDDTVNASAEQNGTVWTLNMYGGLARHKTITQDGMMLVACHELGHHLGGAPKYSGMNWASNEGEADYFANAKCLHRMFGLKATGSFTRKSFTDPVVASACAKTYKAAGDRALCERASDAGMSVSSLLRELGGEPEVHFDTPDQNVVTTTNDNHPAAQCRLDTYFSASLCAVPYTTDVSETDPAVGACTRSQGFTVGMRPHCWYTPGASEGFVQTAAVVTLPKSSTLSAIQADGNVFSGM